MENRKNQSELNFSCDAGVASVNVFTGRLLFERPDIVVGANSFNFGVSHVYDSQRNATLPHSTLMGQGWNLNVQQYLVPNTNVQSATSFVYYDGSGHAHTFIAYENNSRENHFYDTTGLGLILIRTTQVNISEGTLTIEDSQGGRLIFDNQNRLTHIVSAQHRGTVLTSANINNLIVKRIVYSENRITEIFDTRNQNTRRIRLFYETINDNELLTRMDCIQNNIPQYEVRYRYDGLNLSSILDVDVPQGKERIVVVYGYDSQNRLTHVVRKKSGSALRFSYCEESETNQIEKVETGTMPQPAVFVSSSTIVGPVTAGGINQFNERSHSSFTYNVTSGGRNSTAVTNERNIILDYFFNSDGFTTGVFERDPSSPENLMTLTKTSGEYLPVGTLSNERINGRWSVPISNTNWFELPRDIVNTYIRRQMNSNDTNMTTRYVVSFWVKLQSNQNHSNLRAEIRAHFDAGNNPNALFTNEVLLDNTAIGSWQYVTIPIRLRVVNASSNSNRTTLEGLALRFQNLSGEIRVNNIRIAPNQMPEVWIGSGDNIDNNSNVPLLASYWRTTKGIRYRQNGEWTGVAVNSDFYLSESDISATYLNIANSGRETDTTDGVGNEFDLVYWNGTKRMRVEAVQVSETAQTGSGISGTVMPLRVNSRSTTDNGANFQIRNLSSDESFRTVSRHWYSMTNIAQRTFTAVREEGKGNWNERGDEYITTNRQGNILNERDSYDVITTYNYDAAGFGTLESAVVSCTGNSETLTHSFAYDSPAPRDREHLTGHTTNGVTQTASFNNPFATLNTYQNGNGMQSNFVRDIFSRLDQVNQENLANSQNTIEYNDEERIGRLSERNNHGFTFQYNNFGDVTSYGEEFGTSGRNTILTKFYNNRANVSLDNFQQTDSSNFGINNGIQVTETFANATSNNITTTFDNYGKPRRLRVGFNNTDIAYQNNTQFGESRWNGESPSTAQISRMTDRSESRSTIYHYDEDNRPCRYDVVNGVETIANDNNPATRHLSIIQSAPNRTQYWLDGRSTRYETELIMDGDGQDSRNSGGSNPRVMGVRLYNSANTNVSPTSVVATYSYDYTYDHLGRIRTNNLVHRPRTPANSNEIFGREGIRLETTYNYMFGTSLVSSIATLLRRDWRSGAFNQNERHLQSTITTTYGYDGRRNVNRVMESALQGRDNEGGTESGETFSNTHTRLFDYDTQDRVTIERFGIGNFTHASIPNSLDINRRYEYTEGNRVRFVRNSATNAIEREFTYDNSTHGVDNGRGRLRRVTGETVDRTYDNFGNLQSTAMGANWQSFVWHRGNLLGQMLLGDGSTTSRINHSYNSQGVRFRKVEGETTTDYYLDGDKILGEDRITGNVTIRLIYIYGAEGLVGVRRRVQTGSSWGQWQSFNYLKDALGNITAIVDATQRNGNISSNQPRTNIICRYFYTAFGETSVRRADGGELTASDIKSLLTESPIAFENPFRWKSHYWDQIGSANNSSSGYYMINTDGGTRFYDPFTCGYISAESPENLLFNAGEIHGLNRYGITTNNAVALIAALYTIYTTILLSHDESYERDLTWWQRNMRWL
ncbi:MAG: DUF6531 domain-containing protein, partial [Firmicutes bacterium]|nr:DUF6531 domain-containing protein [Bacillota bacterium]